MSDVIDTVLGLVPGDAIDTIRRSREAARDNSEATYQALFAPVSEAEFSVLERFAVASFVVALHAGETPSALFATYDGELLARDAGLAAAVAGQAAAARRPGPFGVYREPGLAAESVPGEAFIASSDVLGERLAAALTHAALLVQRPRESSPAALDALLAAGWSKEGIVTLSQLVAFLAFQVRLVAGLAVLKEAQL